jgi:hypothetical protein
MAIPPVAMPVVPVVPVVVALPLVAVSKLNRPLRMLPAARPAADPPAVAPLPMGSAPPLPLLLPTGTKRFATRPPIDWPEVPIVVSAVVPVL